MHCEEIIFHSNKTFKDVNMRRILEGESKRGSYMHLTRSIDLDVNYSYWACIPLPNTFFLRTGELIVEIERLGTTKDWDCNTRLLWTFISTYIIFLTLNSYMSN